MKLQADRSVLEAFYRAAERVPAYRTLLWEAGIHPNEIATLADFRRVPLLDKTNTFQRFEIDQLCLDGDPGRLASVTTSSGHSGIFAFGLTDVDASLVTANSIDDVLDQLFNVRSLSTFLVNCLPMGVKVPSLACTLADVSVRPDMAIALVRKFASRFAQILLVGDAAFLKHVIELGRKSGVEWRNHRISLIVGEEPLAENARKYFEGLLGLNIHEPERGCVLSSMGVAELGLNLFAEAPPLGVLPGIRRKLHGNPELRDSVLGLTHRLPSLFTYDPGRIFVEFDDEGQLRVTLLDSQQRIPLIRYSTGDRGRFVRLTEQQRSMLGGGAEALDDAPVVAIFGRGDHARAGPALVYPEAVKEGLYFEPGLAEMTTANFRLVSGPRHVRVRIQLSPGVEPAPLLAREFHDAISRYVDAPVEVACEAYERFGSGMTLDYERKFAYLGA